MNKKIIIAIILSLLIGSIIGFVLGVESTIRAVVYAAKPFVTIEVDMVHDAINRYQHRINSCYGNLNESYKN
jgi:uncharacterized membrane protein YqgA involved in biofilm formation